MNKVSQKQNPYSIEVAEEEGAIIIRDLKSNKGYKLEVLSGTQAAGLQAIAEQIQHSSFEQQKTIFEKLKTGVSLLEIEKDAQGRMEIGYGNFVTPDDNKSEVEMNELLETVKRMDQVASQSSVQTTLKDKLNEAGVKIAWKDRTIFHVQPLDPKQKSSWSSPSEEKKSDYSSIPIFGKLINSILGIYDYINKSILLAAIARNPTDTLLRSAGETLQNDPDVVLASIRHKPHSFQYASEALRKDPEFVKKVVAIDGLLLRYADVDVQDNPAVVEIAVKQNGHALQYASPRLRKDLNIVHEAVAINGTALVHAHPSLRSSMQLLKTAVAQNAASLDLADPKIKSDPKLVEQLVGINGLSLQYVGTAFQNNRQIVLTAVKRNGLALEFASKELRSNPEIIRAALESNGLSLQFVNKDLMLSQEKLNKLPENMQSFLALSERANKWLTEHPEFANIPFEEDPNAAYQWLDNHPEFRGSYFAFAKDKIKDIPLNLLPSVIHLLPPALAEELKDSPAYQLREKLKTFPQNLPRAKDAAWAQTNLQDFSDEVVAAWVMQQIQELSEQELILFANSTLENWKEASSTQNQLPYLARNTFRALNPLELKQLGIEHLRFFLDRAQTALSPSQANDWLALHPEFAAKKTIPTDVQEFLEISRSVKNWIQMHPKQIEFESRLDNFPEIIRNFLKASDFIKMISDNPTWQDDPEMVKLAVAENGLALQFASERLRNDTEIVKVAVAQNGRAIEFAVEKRGGERGGIGAKNDPDVVRIATQHDPSIIQYAGSGARANRDIMREILARDGMLLKYAPLFHRDREMILVAVRNNGEAFKFIQEPGHMEIPQQPNLRKDPIVLEAARSELRARKRAQKG